MSCGVGSARSSTQTLLRATAVTTRKSRFGNLPQRRVSSLRTLLHRYMNRGIALLSGCKSTAILKFGYLNRLGSESYWHAFITSTHARRSIAMRLQTQSQHSPDALVTTV